jgi:uncharacterized membrane protein
MKKLTVLSIGIIMLMAELMIFIFTVIVSSTLSVKIISIVIANHLGGRLAFIAAGLENDFSPAFLIVVIIFYNTTYLLIMYSLFVIFSAQFKNIKFIRGYIESMQKKAVRGKKLFYKWNRLSLSFFVWVPLPWTGAVIGSYIANLEGYSTRDTLFTVIPAMWIGVISWTIWFDELYEFIEKFGKGKTMFITVSLLAFPLLVYLLKILQSAKKSNRLS